VNNEEHRLQVAVATYLRYALPPRILWTSTLNGEFMHTVQRAKAKAAGRRAGVPDLLFVLPGGRCCFIELKAARGVLSEEQKLYRDALGSNWALARTLEDVEAALIGWGITPLCEIGKANRYSLDGID
jgi:hypothetical protein